VAKTQKLKARLILESAQTSTQSFFDAFETVRKERGATKGAPTDEEQDLLRASLVFAAAGLDSMLKQLIRETIRNLAEKDPNVQQELETFVQRQIRGDSDDLETVSGHRFLASVLVSAQPQNRVIEEYVRELTGSSLQSADQLFKTAKALGLNPKEVGLDAAKLKRTFDVRNKIIHELDVNLNTSVGTRSRHSRQKPELEEQVNDLLDVGEQILKKVEERLRSG
jgi:hypothetical protein